MVSKEETQDIRNYNRQKVYQIQFHQKLSFQPARKVRPWSIQQDELLLKLHEELNEEPKKWNAIASKMKDRNQNQCLHRYRRIAYSKGQKKIIWSSEEDNSIIDLVKKVGKNWKLLSALLGTKNGKQIRQRFINHLSPEIKRQEWTKEEDLVILKQFASIGSKWSKISQKLPGRPENKIKNRFYSYIQKNYQIKYSGMLKLKNQNQQNQQPQLSELDDQSQKINNLSSGEPKSPKNSGSNKSEFPFLQPSDSKAEKNAGNLVFFEDEEQSKKIGLHSFIRVDESLPQISESRFQSIRSFGSNNDADNQKCLFQLLHQS